MSTGLTYTTKSQAETVAKDYNKQGFQTKIVPMPPGKWKVIKLEVEEGIRKARVERGVATAVKEEFELEDKQKEAVRELISEQKEYRRAEQKRETEKKLKKAELSGYEKEYPNARKEWLKLYKQGLTEKGYEEWIKTRVENPEQSRIEQKKEWSEKHGFPTTTFEQRVVQGKPWEKPVTGIASGSSELIEHTGQQIHVKGGMKQIARDTARTEGLHPRIGEKGAIGTVSPAIASVKEPNFDEANVNIPTGSPLKRQPDVSKLMWKPSMRREREERS